MNNQLISIIGTTLATAALVSLPATLTSVIMTGLKKLNEGV